MRFTGMYPRINKAKNWEVVRILDNGVTMVTPWSYKTKDGAIRYCQSYGFCLDTAAKRK